MSLFDPSLRVLSHALDVRLRALERLRLDLPLGERDRKVMEFEHRRLGARMN